MTVILRTNTNLPGGQVLKPIVPTDGLYAGYVFGAASGRKSPLVDWSDSGRNLVSIGSPVFGDHYAEVIYSTPVRNCFRTPFTVNDLVGATNNEVAADDRGCMVCAVVWAPTSTNFAWIASAYDSLGGDYIGLATRDDTVDRAAIAYHRRNQVSPAVSFHANAPIATTAQYGGNWWFIAGTWSKTRVRAYATYAGRADFLVASSSVPTLAPAGTLPFIIGGAHGNPQAAFDDEMWIHSVWFYRGFREVETVDGVSGVRAVYEASSEWCIENDTGIDIAMAA